MSPAKMVELIEMSIGLWALVGSRNHILDEGPDLPWERTTVRGKGIPGHAQ